MLAWVAPSQIAVFQTTFFFEESRLSTLPIKGLQRNSTSPRFLQRQECKKSSKYLFLGSLGRIYRWSRAQHCEIMLSSKLCLRSPLLSRVFFDRRGKDDECARSAAHSIFGFSFKHLLKIRSIVPSRIYDTDRCVVLPETVYFLM